MRCTGSLKEDTKKKTKTRMEVNPEATDQPVPERSESGVTSDCKHQSALDQHKYDVEHVARRGGEGGELIKGVRMGPK